jgi:flagellar L-ring protein precursor FlgH
MTNNRERRSMLTSPRRFLPATILLALSLSACASYDRLLAVGREPALHPIALPEHAVLGTPPVVLPPGTPPNANALWRTGSRSFFRDPRAAKIGDILTVNIAIGDEATIANTTTRARTASENADLSAFLGFESKLANILPDAVDPTNLVDAGSASNNSGTGTVNRSESINLTVAAVVTDVMPNGNLVIQGQQEVRVNFEVRVLQVHGMVRPEDISNANTIQHTQIAEARISYGGRGHITDVQQPRYGQQVFDILFPW